MPLSGVRLPHEGGSLLEACPCLLDFISTVVCNTASDPSVLSFTLKVTGLMAASEDGFKTLQVELSTPFTFKDLLPTVLIPPPPSMQEGSVLDLVFDFHRWQEAGLWEDPCLRIAWIQGLKNMLQHPKALMFFVKSGDAQNK